MRPHRRVKTGHDRAGARSERQALLPVRGRQAREQVKQRASEQGVRQPHRRQRVAHRKPVVVGRENDERQRCPRRQGQSVSAEPFALVRVLHPGQHRHRRRNREIDDHLEPDRQRQRGRQPERDPAAQPPGVGNCGNAQREQRKLPAVMIDPQGHEHAVGGPGEEQGDERQREGALVDQAAGRQREREEQQQIGQQRRNRDRPALRGRTAEQRPKRQDQPGERKIDQPRPVDVGAERRAQPVLAKVVPVLPMEQAAHLHHAHIVVGIAEREDVDRRPMVEQEPAAKAEPGQQHDPFPVPRDKSQCPLVKLLILALAHFSAL